VIVADTSALIAIAFGEAERARFMEILLDEDSVLISSVSVLEARMVAHGRRGPRATRLRAAPLHCWSKARAGPAPAVALVSDACSSA
jgi:ribonuclease VapC